MKKLEKYQYEIITVIGSVFLGAWWAFDYPNSPIFFFTCIYFFGTLIFLIDQKNQDRKLCFLNALGMVVGHIFF